MIRVIETFYSYHALSKDKKNTIWWVNQVTLTLKDLRVTN